MIGMKNSRPEREYEIESFMDGWSAGYEAGKTAVINTCAPQEAAAAAVKFRETWEDVHRTAAMLFLLAEYLWGTCPERRDRNTYIKLMSLAECNISPEEVDHCRKFCSVDGRTPLAKALHPDFDPRTAIAQQLDRRLLPTVSRSTRCDFSPRGADAEKAQSRSFRKYLSRT